MFALFCIWMHCCHRAQLKRHMMLWNCNITNLQVVVICSRCWPRRSMESWGASPPPVASPWMTLSRLVLTTLVRSTGIQNKHTDRVSLIPQTQILNPTFGVRAKCRAGLLFNVKSYCTLYCLLHCGTPKRESHDQTDINLQGWPR